MLGQGAFVAVGGFGTLLLGPGHAGLPLGLAAAAATALAGVLGWLVGFGAARLRGPYLALATWALAWLVQSVLLAFPSVGGGAQGLTAPSPARLVSPGLGTVLTLTPAVHVGIAATLVLVVLAASVRLEAGPGGLDLAALRGGPDLAAGLGVPGGRAPARRAGVAATLGGLSGAGTAVLLGLVAPADVGPLLGLELVVAVLAGAALVGRRAPALAPVVGVALLLALPPLADALAGVLGTSAERARGALTALLLAVVLALRVPGVRRLLPGGGARCRCARPRPHRRPGRSRRRGPCPRPHPRPPGSRPRDARRPAPTGPGAAADPGAHRRVRRPPGGRRRLADPAQRARCTPWSARTARARPPCCGCSPARSPPTAAVVVLAGRSVARLRHRRPGPAPAWPAPRSAPWRCRACDPAGQVAVGARGGARRPFAVLRHLLATPSSRAEARRRSATVARVLAETGLSHLAARGPAVLVVAEQRLLQIARAAATGAPVLLLDEPAAGMTARRAGAPGRPAARGWPGTAGRCCSSSTTCAWSTPWPTGSPSWPRAASSPTAPRREVRADPAVRTAYLGPAPTSVLEGPP